MMIIVSQATPVGQTTAEGVLEFPKHEIRDLRCEVLRSVGDTTFDEAIHEDFRVLSLERNHAIVNVQIRPKIDRNVTMVTIRFNNGVTIYEETLLV
ncbi:hypothetical protein [Methanocalculus sp. MSAO_Arc2]|uniref:hypothetical protein n=1 Tax=Methanocalculus sp. MSAO_Arc2 TaxID=2293855 RepID=UPI0026A151AA